MATNLLSDTAEAVLSIRTVLGSDKLLVLRMEGHEQLGSLFEYRVDMAGNINAQGMREDIRLGSLLGTRADVTMDVKGAQRHINGFITRAQRGERNGRFDTFSVVMRPWTWFATRSRDSRVFQNQSVKDIVSDVLGTYSSDFEWRLLAPSLYPTLDYCTQYDETDLDFVSRLLEDAGIYYFFEHTSTTHTMVLTDSMAKHRSKADGVPITLAPSLKEDASMMNWQAHEEVRSVKVTLRDTDYLASRNEVEATRFATPTAATAKLGKAEVYEFPAGVVQNQVQARSQPTTDVANQCARLRVEEQQSMQATCTGTTNAVDVAVGETFLLNKPNSGAESENYLVVAAAFRAEYADREASANLKAVKRLQDGFVADIVAIDLKGSVFRPVRRTPRPRMLGPQTATVVGAPGRETEVDEHGRIKIQFHWDRVGQHSQNSSCWVRVALPWAGKGRGLWCLPRVDDEVVVSFIGGDPDRPLITGSVHNDANTTPYELPKLAYTSGWRSHSMPQGGTDMYNELRFADEKTKEYVWLQAQRDYYRRVKENAFHFVGKNETRKVKLTRQEVVGENWFMHVGQDMMLESGKDWHSKVAGDIFTTGGATWQVHLASDWSLKAGADAGIEVSGKTAWKSGADLNLQSGTAVNVKAGGNLLQQAAQKLSLKAGGDLVQQGANVKIRGDGEVVIEAARGLTLVCGSSSISLSAGGVEIIGTMVKVNSGGGGGSAGTADEAASAEPHAPAQAKTQRALQPGQASIYDQHFNDPIQAGGSAAPTA